MGLAVSGDVDLYLRSRVRRDGHHRTSGNVRASGRRSGSWTSRYHQRAAAAQIPRKGLTPSSIWGLSLVAWERCASAWTRCWIGLNASAIVWTRLTRRALDVIKALIDRVQPVVHLVEAICHPGELVHDGGEVRVAGVRGVVHLVGEGVDE